MSRISSRLAASVPTGAAPRRFNAFGLGTRWAVWRRARPARAEAVPVRDWVSVSPGRPTRLLGFDQTLLALVVALMALGVVMVFSASVAMPDNPKCIDA